MKQEKTLLGACALAALVSGCQTMPVADPIKEAQAIRALDQGMVDAVAAKDAAKVASYYSEDATLLPPNQDAKTGDALRKEWADTVALPGLHLTWAPTRVEVDADSEMAIDVGTYEFSMDGPKGKVDDHGKYAQVWEKKNGQWKLATDMYNSSVPLPPPPAPVTCPPPAPACPVAPSAAKTKKK